MLCVVCCVFWFFSRVCALFCPVSQHTAVGPSFMLVDARLSAPHHPSPSPPHPLLAPHLSLPVTGPFPACHYHRSVLRFRAFGPALDPVSSNIAAHRWGFAFALGHLAGTMLRFRGIQGEIGPKKPDIAAHRARWDDVRRESTGARHGGGARAQNPGCGAWSAGDGRLEAWGSGTQGLGEGLQKC